MRHVGAGGTKRLFVACDLPHETTAAVEAWRRRELAGRGELRVPTGVHLTLCFLGDVPVERVADVEDALGRVHFAALELDVAGPLFLPARGPRRVVALELVDLSGALVALQADVSRALAERRLYRPEQRAFLPHVTVARYRRPGPPFSLQNVNVPRFGVTQMVLYSSLLERACAVHTPVAVFTAS